MTAAWLMLRQGLLFLRRQPFFRAWNTLVLLLVLILNHYTYFDLEGGSLAAGLFFATVGLATAVNSFVYALESSRGLSGGLWDLLLTRPATPLGLCIGRWAAVVLFN